MSIIKCLNSQTLQVKSTVITKTHQYQNKVNTLKTRTRILLLMSSITLIKSSNRFKGWIKMQKINYHRKELKIYKRIRVKSIYWYHLKKLCQIKANIMK